MWGQTTIALSEPELQLTTAGLRLTLSDYLGSPRVVIDASGLVQERNTYYPSGLQIDVLSSTAAGTSDYTAGWANGQRIPAFAAYAGQLHGRRYLDPAISTWYAVEPLATQYAGVSPYNYALGDPVNLSDATGYMPGPEWQLGLDASNGLLWSDIIGPGGQPRGLSLWQQRGIYTHGTDFTSPYGYLPIPIFLENTYKIDHYWNNGYINSEGQNVVTSVEYRFTTYGSERVFLGYLSVPVSSLLPNITGKIGIAGSNAPQYSGSGPLSTATAQGPGGDCPECYESRMTDWNGDVPHTLDDFVQVYNGKDLSSFINEKGYQLGLLPYGPKIRYIKDPLGSYVIDLRHMLYVGKKGPVFGGLVEAIQTLFKDKSGMNPQDFYSNELGYKFYQWLETDPLARQTLSSNPENFVYLLNMFLRSPELRK